MWEDPSSIEYVFFGVNLISMIAGLLVFFLIALAVYLYYKKSGRRGRSLLMMTFITSFPLMVGAFIMRTVVTFLTGLMYNFFTPTRSFTIPVLSLIDIAFVGSAIYMLWAIARMPDGRVHSQHLRK